MVATRRGVRVCSPSKTNRDQSSDVQATPTGPRTRSTAKKAESPTQHASAETCSHHEKVDGELPLTPSIRRCTRASRLHSPELPSTPVGSTHEADISDVESCCSARSDIKPQLAGTRRRQPRVSREDDDISEVESCSSAVSASRVGRSTRRSLRRRTIPKGSDAPQFEAGDAKVDLELEPEPCSSVTSESRRVTRSQRKTACTRSSAKQQTDSELSDTDSYMSGVSGPGVSKSTSRRVTRSRKQTGPIPIHLDEASESSRSPAPASRRSRAARGKAAATVDVSESQSCDSDGFESGPTYSLANRRREKTRAMDSDSELSNVHSPMSSPCITRSRGTSCSTRAGSGISSQGTSPSRCVTILEKAEEPAEEDTLNDSRLESTVVAEDADGTLLEENESQTLEGIEKDGVSGSDLTSNEADTAREEKEVNAISEEHPPMSDMQLDVSVCATDASESAVSVIHQQEELSDENESEEKPSEMEVMQETVHSPEPPQPCQSVALCETTPETTEEVGERGRVTAAADDALPSQRDDAVEEGAVEQTLPEDQEKMEVIRSDNEAQQVVHSSEAQVESIQVTSSQQHILTEDSGPEQQPDDVIVQKTTKISLLSSEDEDEEEDEEEEGEVDEEEGEVDLGHTVEDGGGSSNKSEAAGTSVDGLFMIDTRPGQDADDQYYMEKLTEEEAKAAGEKGSEEEQDEEFVDEEGGEDDDEDADVLFTRNSLVKEMSSRIDPGIKVKDLGGLYINFDGSKSKPVSSSQQKLKEKKIQDEVMKRSVIGPDFEKKDVVPPYTESKQALKLKHRVEREKSTGDGWFNMKAPEMSQELKGELHVLKMRGSLDPKRFYKKNDRDGFPKFFQVGTVVDNPVDFYHSRIPKKERKRTMVEELLADAEFRHTNKKKYQQIIADKAAKGAGKWNKKKKVHKK